MSEAKQPEYTYIFFGKRQNLLLQIMSIFDMITNKGNQSEAARPPDYSSSELGGIKSIPPDENERRDDDDYIFGIF